MINISGNRDSKKVKDTSITVCEHVGKLQKQYTEQEDIREKRTENDDKTME
jgi:hypothetical protein